MTTVPKLRFPEFRKADDWRLGCAGDIFSNRSERGIEELEIYSVTLNDGMVKRSSLERKITDLGDPSGNKRVYRGDIVYNMMRMWQGASGVAADDCMVSPAYIVLSLKHGYSSEFFGTLLKLPQSKLLLTSHSRGLTEDRLRLYFNDFASIPIRYPKPPEQKKIADCLRSLDDLITAHRTKLTALQNHKKGLLQQLFPAEGQTTPTLRLPEFRNQPRWEKVSLGEIADIQLGKMLDRSKHTSGTLLPYLNNLSVRWNEVDISNLPEMHFKDRELKRFGLKDGDVVVCEGGEPGRAAVWDGRLPQLKFQKAIHRVRFTPPFEPSFLVLYLEGIAGSDEFEKLFTGGGIKHLTRETFSKLKIPKISHPEQKQICNILTSAASLITTQTEKISALQTHKKGLMQQLFPCDE